MDRQTLRDWVHRYNAEGLDGLVNRAVPLRPRRLAPEQMAALAAWIEAGPDPARDGVVRWRRKDLQHRIKDAFGVVLHERSVGKQLAALGYRRLSVRPQRSLRGRETSRWRSGSRTKRAWVSRGPSPASGPGAAPGPARPATPAINGHTCSMRSARRAGLRRGWSCPSSTRRR